MLKNSKGTKKTALGLNIARLRKLRGWTAEKFAEEAKVAYPTVRDIEAGYSNGRESTRKKLADTLGVSISALYADSESDGKSDGKADLTLEIITALPSLNEDELRLLVDRINTFPSRTAKSETASN